jgi:antitoxin (DNA-binding transcriptional repressor) of toxin-antitoxin stability system
MKITTKQLKTQSEKIISQVNNGQEVTIIHKGKTFAKIIPFNVEDTIENVALNLENELFGLWKNREDIDVVDQYVRKMRKGRNLC